MWRKRRERVQVGSGRPEAAVRPGAPLRPDASGPGTQTERSPRAGGRRLPGIPMNYLIQRFARTSCELGAYHISKGNQGSLHHLSVRNAKDHGCFLLVYQVERRPRGTKASGASGKHETPGGGQDDGVNGLAGEDE